MRGCKLLQSDQLAADPFEAELPTCLWSNVDLDMVKTVSTANALPGDTITFTLTYSNAGPGTATFVAITDSMPVSVTVTGFDDSGALVLLRGGSRYAWDVEAENRESLPWSQSLLRCSRTILTYSQRVSVVT